MLYQSLVDFKGWTFIAQILNLFLQMYLFKKFLFEPVKKIFARRRQEVDELYAEADKARLDAETARSDYESRLRSADEEARAITAQAVQSARLAGDEIVSGAGASGRVFDTAEQLIAALPGLLQPGDAVLVKASRGARFERISEAIKAM